jgi:hypothetical protein
MTNPGEGRARPSPDPQRKEKLVNDDRITYRQLAQLIDGRDARTAHAIENAVRGVNAAETTIRQTATMITSKLAETIARLDRGLSLNDLGELQRTPTSTAPSRSASTTGRSSALCSPKPRSRPCSPPPRPPRDRSQRRPATASSRDGTVISTV